MTEQISAREWIEQNKDKYQSRTELVKAGVEATGKNITTMYDAATAVLGKANQTPKETKSEESKDSTDKEEDQQESSNTDNSEEEIPEDDAPEDSESGQETETISEDIPDEDSEKETVERIVETDDAEGNHIVTKEVSEK
jgi:hypothetical protein